MLSVKKASAYFELIIFFFAPGRLVDEPTRMQRNDRK